MSDFKAKMHQIRFLLGLRPRPAGELIVLPRSLTVFKEPVYTSMGREGKWRKGNGEGRGKEVGGIWPNQKVWRDAPYWPTCVMSCAVLNVCCIATVFGRLLLRAPDELGRPSTDDINKRTKFMLHFINTAG